MTTQQTAFELAGLDNLSLPEMKRLVEAKRAQLPTAESFSRDGWDITIDHHVHTGGHWSADAACAAIRQYGHGGYGESTRCLSSGDAESDCRRKVEEFFASGKADAVRAKLEKTWSDYAAWATRRQS